MTSDDPSWFFHFDLQKDFTKMCQIKKDFIKLIIKEYELSNTLPLYDFMIELDDNTWGFLDDFWFQLYKKAYNK